MRTHTLILAALLPAMALADDTDGDGWHDTFPIDRSAMSASGENRYWNLQPGRFVVLGEIEPGGSEFVVISVLDETETVDGVETRVVEEREFEDGELVEVSRNFYAMAADTGDVYYFGEDVDNYEDGEIAGHGGEWRAGVDGARAGLYMPASPAVGMKFYLEHAPEAAMDRAEIFETDATIDTPAGTFTDCLIVTESSPLEPGDESYKRYAPDVGMIFDDGLELYKKGERRPSERWLIEIKITEDQMPKIPAGIVRDLHPTGVIREAKVELHRSEVRYAIETFVDDEQWDVEVNDTGKVHRNEPD